MRTTGEWRRAGAPPPAGPTRRTQRYAGTDRQVRGLLLAVLREATVPVPRARLDVVWPDEVQRTRALAGLIDDGLACELDGHYQLGAAEATLGTSKKGGPLNATTDAAGGDL